MGLLRWATNHLVAVLLIAVLFAALVFRQELASEFGFQTQMADLDRHLDWKRYWPTGTSSTVKVREAAPAPAKPLAVVEQKGAWDRFWPTGSVSSSVARVRPADPEAAAKPPQAAAALPQVRPAPPAVPVPAAGMQGMYGMGGMTGMQAQKAPAPAPASVAAPAPTPAPRPVAAPAANLRDGWMQARRAYAIGDLNAAAEAYRALVAQYPEEADIAGELGNVYMLQGRGADAADAFYEAGQRLLRGPNWVRAQAVLPVLNQLDMAKADSLRKQILQAVQGGR
ncbi:MAG: hypothetical protein H7841_10955 [Magnetospirillum sp. WYHS-4]